MFGFNVIWGRRIKAKCFEIYDSQTTVKSSNIDVNSGYHSVSVSAAWPSTSAMKVSERPVLSWSPGSPGRRVAATNSGRQVRFASGQDKSHSLIRVEVHCKI